MNYSLTIKKLCLRKPRAALAGLIGCSASTLYMWEHHGMPTQKRAHTENIKAAIRKAAFQILPRSDRVLCGLEAERSAALGEMARIDGEMGLP